MNFTKALEQFVATIQAKTDAYMVRECPTLPKAVISIDEGQKFIRVKRDNSVYCFIEKATGNILKPAGYKAPEKKNPRGNIYAEDGGVSGCTPYGVAYLKGGGNFSW